MRLRSGWVVVLRDNRSIGLHYLNGDTIPAELKSSLESGLRLGDGKQGFIDLAFIHLKPFRHNMLDHLPVGWLAHRHIMQSVDLWPGVAGA